MKLQTNVATDSRYDRFVDAYRKHFHGVPRVFRAPGRVNLIGEHTDYNDGFVLPAAIDFDTWVGITPRTDNDLVIYSENLNETATFDLKASTGSNSHHWSDYVLGVALTLRNAGCEIEGANLYISGNVPLGSGLSSSAAIEVASAMALTTHYGSELSKLELAKLCQRVENDFVGARCGIMDQFVSCHGVAGSALLLDCRSLDFESLPLKNSVSLVVCNTMVKHALAGGEYNLRRADCELGVSILARTFPAIKALRDATLEQLEQCASNLPETVFRRCRHVINENSRVLQAADALRNGDLSTFGTLMKASHQSLQSDFEVSCEELDLMVELAETSGLAYGSRMTGGGFGGCTINLVLDRNVDQFTEIVRKAYAARTGRTPEIYISRAANGAGEVTA
jgi:galactokinase